MPTPTISTEFAVIGAGLAGSSVAWRLAQQGSEVVLLERDQPASEFGSSHGSARIFRYAYPDPFFTGLVVQARASWDELERASGRRLITPSGSLDFGAVRNPDHLARVLDSAGVAHELLSSGQAAQRWPHLVFDTDVLWHPGAGVLDAESTVLAMVDLAVAGGAQLLTNWEAHTVTRRPLGQGWVITSSTGDTIECSELVIAAGGWLPVLLENTPLPLELRNRIPALEVRQENAYHFPYRDPADCGEPAPDEGTSWPTFIYKGPQIQVYSLPGGRDAGFRGQKVAEYCSGKVIASARDQDGVIDDANRERVRHHVATQVPGLEPTPYAETTCLFTNVPGEDMIIDRCEGITVVSPCSGQGAKFAPLFGEFVVDLLQGHRIGDGRFLATGRQFAH